MQTGRRQQPAQAIDPIVAAAVTPNPLGARHDRVLIAAPHDERARRMSTPWAPTLTRALAIVLLAALVAAACGDDDGDASSDTTQPNDNGATSTTEPPGTKPGEVRPFIVDLLARYDEVTNEIVADPSVANDRENPLTQDYLAIVEPDSDAEGAIQTWIDNAAEGITIRPYDDNAPAQVTSLDGDIETVSEDEVRFPTCVAQNYRQYDGQGRETEFVTGQSVPGQTTAVRVDGEWRLRRLDIATNVVGCGGGDA